MRKKGLVLALCALMLTGCGGPAVEADGTAALTEEVKYVALTFDDGPRRGTTDVLLDGLKERGAAATFFLIGESISGKEDLVERMAAEGHQVGNHTWTHLRLETESAAVIQEELSRTDAAIGAILGGSSYWVRVPYGLLSQGSEGLIQVPMVKWSVDPRDWESRNKEKIVSAVCARGICWLWAESARRQANSRLLNRSSDRAYNVKFLPFRQAPILRRKL